MKNLFLNFLFSRRGTTSIEYALIAGLIFLGIIVAVSGLGGNVRGLFQSMVDNYPQQ